MSKNTQYPPLTILFICLFLICGCTQPQTIHEITIIELLNNPEQYEDQTVKLPGYYVFKQEETNGQIVYTLSDDQYNSVLAILSEKINDSILIKNNQYLWTGTVSILYNGNIQISVTEITQLSNQSQI